MSEWAKILISSSVIASIFGGVVSWLTASHKIDQERYSRQGESGYEALIKANSLRWTAFNMMKKANTEKDTALAAEAEKTIRESNALYDIARQKIAAFGSASVVKAMSEYYSKHTDAAKTCDNSKKFRADVQVYKSIRSTLGVGGGVSDEELATVVFLCSLK